MKNYKVLDLFSGCGGLSKGFELAGFDVVAANDVLEHASLTYKRNHPNTKFFLGDITDDTVRRKIVSYVKGVGCDVIVGGPPCQAYSMAGRRDPNDPRGKLFEEYVKVVKELKPSMFVIENVKGILTMKHGKELVTELISKSFRDIGYTVEFKVLNSANYGVPQKRERVIFIGQKRGGVNISWPEPTHSESGGFGLKKWRTVRDAIVDLEGSGDNASINHILTHHKASFIKKIEQTPIGESVIRSYGDAYRRTYPDKPSPTVKENHGSVFVHYKHHRVMSARELARLQSFPDDFIFEGGLYQQLTQLGNAVPVELAKSIGLCIKQSLNMRGGI